MAAEHFSLDYFQIIANHCPLLSIIANSSIILNFGELFSNDAMNWSDDDNRPRYDGDTLGAVGNESSKELCTATGGIAQYLRVDVSRDSWGWL